MIEQQNELPVCTTTTVPVEQLQSISLSPYKKTKKALIAVVALQLLLLAGVTAPSAYTLSTGRVVTLKTVPVDPSDVFRGDYVSLNYDMSRQPMSGKVTDGSEVYVVLRQTGRYWSVRTASATRPNLLPGEVCIKGKAENSWDEKVSIHYGIEQVFVPERTGGDIERSKDITVDVAVDANGNSAIKRMLNGDQVIYDAKSVIFGG
jgi:uncharacterized membrane-anchored protein